MHQETILLIDDEISIRDSLSSFLRDEGYRVFTAENGKLGLDIFFREAVDLILTDLRMPVMDGISFLQKGMRYLEDTTVIMMSAFGTIDLALSAMQAGAYDFISKPFKSDEVLLKHITEGFMSKGSPMAMPPKGGNPTLTESDIRSVIGYLRSIYDL